MSARRIAVALLPLVMTGVVLFTAAACGQQDQAATPAVAKPSLLAGVSDSRKWDASPTAIETVANELSQELLTLKGIAGVGIGQSEGSSPCIKVYLENDSVDLKSKVPTQFGGFPVVTEVTGPIEALPAQTGQPIQQSPGSRVELDIFSGVSNPTWMLTLPEASDLTSRISRLDPTEAMEQRPEDLGYRGFIVQIPAASSATVQTIRAYHGIVEVVDSTGTAYYLDPQRQIELWLLATSKAPLEGKLIAEIVEEINQE